MTKCLTLNPKCNIRHFMDLFYGTQTDRRFSWEWFFLFLLYLKFLSRNKVIITTIMVKLRLCANEKVFIQWVPAAYYSEGFFIVGFSREAWISIWQPCKYQEHVGKLLHNSLMFTFFWEISTTLQCLNGICPHLNLLCDTFFRFSKTWGTYLRAELNGLINLRLQ